MKKIMNKKIFLLLLTLIFVLSGCQNTTSPAEPTDVTPPPTTVEMPTLPDLDFTNLNFMDDGYEVVELKGTADGDTATFIVGGLPVNTRFLAIDTPEISSPTEGMQPWAQAAKDYTLKVLSEAKQIILEKDEESDIFDSYDRLLAWVWVDGELLNYKLVEEGLAYVKYLYGDYKYNPTMIKLERQAQDADIKIWGEKDPNYDYEKVAEVRTLGELRQIPLGSNAITGGIITSVIGKNAFIQDESGAVYVYTNKYNYMAIVKGNEIALTAKITEYNGLMELSDILDKKITKVSEGHDIQPEVITLDQIGEAYEAYYIRVNDVTVTRIVEIEGQKGYDVVIEKDDTASVIRVDKYLDPYINPDFFQVGDTFDVIGNVGQYNTDYQIMIESAQSIIK